jgi:hypothetical protein
MAKKSSPEAIESVGQCFPEGLREDPTAKTVIETIATMTKASLAAACADMLPAEYPSKRKAERETKMEALRRDFATLVAALMLGHKTDRETADPNAAALVTGARAWAREIEIQRIEAKAKEAAARLEAEANADPNEPKIRTLDGRSLTKAEAMAEIAHRAQVMIIDHERVTGRPARDHERRTAVRVARSELLGMTKSGAEAVTRAMEKRARKAARLAREFPTPAIVIG